MHRRKLIVDQPAVANGQRLFQEPGAHTCCQHHTLLAFSIHSSKVKSPASEYSEAAVKIFRCHVAIIESDDCRNAVHKLFTGVFRNLVPKIYLRTDRNVKVIVTVQEI